MTISVLVNGALGRMGQAAVKAVQADAAFKLVGQTTRNDHLSQAIKSSGAQVVIDFTLAECAFSNTKMILEAGAHPVIGTSGLTLKQVAELQKIAEYVQTSGVIAPNFSLGAVLAIKYAKEIARFMPNAEIIEVHHDKKNDSPSGTAIHAAEALIKANPYLNQTTKSSHETIPGARGANLENIPIHALRLPGTLAELHIVFGSKGETLSLKHNSIDRECFMPGVVLACKKVMQLDRLIYGLEQLL